MRRPFHIAEAYGMGLYNDMTGHERVHRRMADLDSGRWRLWTGRRRKMRLAVCQISGRQLHRAVNLPALFPWNRVAGDRSLEQAA